MYVFHMSLSLKGVSANYEKITEEERVKLAEVQKGIC